jgi:predicted nucleic acid-binding protein
MIYLDASALVTWIARRQHVDALEKYVGKGVTETCTSTIGLIETVRTCDRLGNYPRLMTTLLDDHVEIPVSDQVRDGAANFAGQVRSLDAIHIASAELLGSELEALVTYDKRMAEAARNAGLPVETPGMK